MLLILAALLISWEIYLRGSREKERGRLMSDQNVQSAPALDLSTKLAFDRTWVAYERTMLAWVRTATSLITFGFSVYKFFQIVRAEGDRSNHLIGARQFGLLLVVSAWLRWHWRRWNIGRIFKCWEHSIKVARAHWRSSWRL
jgi:uncharacterized membrane protein YidH (DUF202 family)